MSLFLDPNLTEDMRLPLAKSAPDLWTEHILKLFLPLGDARLITDEIRKNIPEDEILSRQSVFHDMLNGEIHTYMLALAEALTDYTATADAYIRESDPVLKTVLFLSKFNRYAAFVRLSGDSGIAGKATSQAIKEYIDYYIGIAASLPSTEAEEEALKAVRCCFRLSVGESNVGTGKIVKPSKDNYTVVLAAYARAMGFYGNTEVKTQMGKLSPYITSAIKEANAGHFSVLEEFEAKHRNDTGLRTIEGYRVMLSFYNGLQRLYEKLTAAGICLSVPVISHTGDISITAMSDPAIAAEGRKTTPNDISFYSTGKLLMLTGANGGGKTTCMRTLGCCLCWGLSGFYVPAESAELPCFTKILTHYPVDESFTENGRLRDETDRLNEMYRYLGSSSFVFLNETYSSTDEHTASDMAEILIDRIAVSGSYMIYVTHNFNLINRLEKTDKVRFAEAEDFIITEKAPSKTSMAYKITGKYGLTYEGIKGRLKK